MKIILLFSTLVLMANLAECQNNCKKCDIDLLVTISQQLKTLNETQVNSFYCTISEACGSNVEFSEFSSELLPQVLMGYPNESLKVLTANNEDSLPVVLVKLENLSEGTNTVELMNSIKQAKGRGSLKKKLLRAISIAEQKLKKEQ